MKIVRISDEFSFDRRQTWEFFSDPFEDYCSEEDAVGGQSRIKKYKAAKLLLTENRIIRVRRGTDGW